MKPFSMRGKRIGGLTPAYASLEMWNSEPPDPRDDIYAFACVIYELVSGRHPFGRASAKQAFDAHRAPPRVASLKRSQWEALKKGLALQRERRTASVGEFLKAFAPQSRIRKYALPAALAAVIVAAIAIAVSARFYGDALIKDYALCAQIPRPAAIRHERPPGFQPSQEQVQSVDDSLLLAEDYMRDATPVTTIDDLKYILSEGPNSVNDIVDGVLRIDPSEPRALELKRKIAGAYADRARELLLQRQFDAALDLVRAAETLQPDSQELFRLEQNVCRCQLSASELTAQVPAPASCHSGPLIRAAPRSTDTLACAARRRAQSDAGDAVVGLGLVRQESEARDRAGEILRAELTGS